MDIEQLKTFIQLAQYKSYSKTAMKLHVTQPAVSIRMKALEEEIGQKLIERIGKEIIITPAGQYFYDSMINIVNNISDTIKMVQQFSPPSEFSVGASPFGAIYVLAKLLPKLYHKSNYIPMNIRTVPQPHQLIEMYTKGIIDMAIFSIHILPKGLSYEFLWEEPIVLVSNPSHPLTKSQEISLNDIKDSPIVLLTPERDTNHYNQRIIKLCEEQNIQLNIKAYIDNLEIAKELVQKEQILSFLPYLTVQDYIDEGRLIKLNCRLQSKISQSVYLLSRANNEFYSEFYGLLKEFASKRKQELAEQF